MSNNKINSLIGEEHIKTLFSIFKNQNAEIRLVGGSIRDLLMNREISDIDSATELEPNDVLDLLKKNNIEYDDFAIRYGSIIAYPNNQKIQITSLREDINQLGRHTSVLYTKDWKKDAARRDFTFNALYFGEDCKLYDYYNGQQDLKDKAIKFIGEIEERIKEDKIPTYQWIIP
jgi:poly(A) polymerase